MLIFQFGFKFKRPTLFSMQKHTTVLKGLLHLDKGEATEYGIEWAWK